MKKAFVFTSLFLTSVSEATIVVTTNGTEATVFCSENKTTVETLNVPFLSPDVSSVVFSITNGLYYYPATGSTYSGGTDVLRGQLYINRGDALGTGPVRIGASGFASSLLIRGASVVLGNKVVFGTNSCYAVGINNDMLTLKSVGVVESGATKGIRLGRTSAGEPSKVCLSLTDPESEAIEYLSLSGALALTLDGGVIKARADAATPFVRMATADEPDITVSTNGITFNVADGADLSLGAPLKFARVPVYTVLETYQPANNSFETGLAPWSIAILPEYTQSGEVRTNGSPFDTQKGVEWHTPDGSKYVMLRQHAVLSTTINVPTSGEWRLRLLVGCRPGGGYSTGIRTDVKIGDEVVFSFPALESSEIHPFEELSTTPFALTGGVDYTLSLVNATGNKDCHMNFDRIVLDRVSASCDAGAFSKTGCGMMSLESHSIDSIDTSVSEGTMKFFDCRLADMTLSVAGTAALHRAQIASDAAVSVASGGKLALMCSGTNLLVNGSFEADPVGFTTVTPAGWSLTVDPEDVSGRNADVNTGKSASGVQMNGTTPSRNGPVTPYGKVTVFLREYTNLSQSFNAPKSGKYRISYVQANRKYEVGYKMPFTVSVDGNQVVSVPPHDGNYDFERHEIDVELAAGEHVLVLRSGRSTNGVQGEMILVDDVSVRAVGDFPEISGEIRMESGSVLELDAAADLSIPNFYVDGNKINGRRGAIVRAGVTVTGSGDILAGEIPGMHIIFR